MPQNAHRLFQSLTCILAAGVALALAAPAGADPSLGGTYAIVGGDDEFSATFTPTCQTQGCTASVVSNRGWTSVATLNNGRWNFDVTKPDGVVCANGNYANVVIAYSFDPTTLAGQLTADSNGECPGGQVTQVPVQLQKVG